MPIKWKPEYAIQVNDLDKHHMKLLDLTDVLEKGITNKASEEAVSYALDFLREYLIVHFITEEDYMQRFNYGAFSKHKIEHEYFLEKIVEFERKESSSVILSKRMISFLNSWLVDHVLTFDKKLGKYLNEHGVE